MRDVGIGLALLCLGVFLTWVTVQQYRTRQPTGETIFDVVGAVIPALRQPMFWVSLVFLGLLSVTTLVGSAAFFLKAFG